MSPKDKDKFKDIVIAFFNDLQLVETFMLKVIDNWRYSCDHNLSNKSMNRIAYLGQAACCMYAKVPNLATMYSWKFVDFENRARADKKALQIILIWEQRRDYKIISNNGSKKATKTGYQMKLLLS